MPKLKQSESDKMLREYVAEIRKQQRDIACISVKQLGAAVGVSEATMYNRFNNPREFTLGEMLLIKQRLRVELPQL